MKKEDSIEYYESLLTYDAEYDISVSDSICTGDICCGSNFTRC